jgi:xanthine dehydrogenase YagR molybdenum-binding subunit
VHGVLVSSTIARGRIRRLDDTRARAVPGVLRVFSHQNRPKMPWFDRSYRDQDSPPGSPFRPLYDDRIVFDHQPIALVVAETLEIAHYAASLVTVEYEAEAPATELEAHRSEAYTPTPRLGIGGPPPPRGDADGALAGAEVRVEAEYSAPAEHHNPMELHATTVIVEDDGSFAVHDKTQSVLNTQQYLAHVFELPRDKIRVRSPFVGGAFGSTLRPQHQLFFATMAARDLGRSVRVVQSREEMFASGHRPETWQRVRLGAGKDGKLVAITHEAVAETSRFEDYSEGVVNWASLLYQCDNVRSSHQVTALDIFTPLDMRAPGAAWGLFALESAMDELAVACGVDPLALRLINYAERDQSEDKPFSSKELRACYAEGAERFGWARRPVAPRSMREGHKLVGWGMATGVWDAMQMPARARAVLGLDGKLTVSSATADIGTGTYTVMTQIAAATLGLPCAAVTFKLGDSALPLAPLEGGSWTVASVGSAVKLACEKVRGRLLDLARALDHSPLSGATPDEVTFAEGYVSLTRDPTRRVSFLEAMREGGVSLIDEDVSSVPHVLSQKDYSRHTHSAVFVEVKVDEELGTIEVTRVVSAIAAGRILNPKTARSQILGGIVWGIGMALEEERLTDHRLGRAMNHSLAEYHVPVNADVRALEVIFVEEHDEIVNPLGAKGVGEIGVVGVAAAIASAVHHATGRRVRSLPITLDKLL